MDGYESQLDALLTVLQEAKEMVTPFTDSISGVTNKLQKNIDRLTCQDAVLDVMVTGNGICGKSELIDVLLGDTVVGGLHVGQDIVVKPGISKIPLLRNSHGKTLAVEVEGVRNWLRDHKPQCDALDDEETPTLLLEATPQFLNNNLAMQMNLIDTKRDTIIASLKNGYLTYNADVFIILIDYEILKTDKEYTILEQFKNPLFKGAPCENFVFVVNNASQFFATHLHISNIHVQEEDKPKFESLKQVTSYVIDLIKPVMNKIKKQQVVVLHTKLAHYARIVHNDNSGTPLEIIYDYCEMGYGSAYMQTIDSIPESDLRCTAALHAEGQLKDSGLEYFEQCLSTIAYNGAPLFLLSVCTDLEHVLNKFGSVLEAQLPQLQLQKDVTETEHRQLTKELSFVDSKLEQVKHVISLMRSELQGVIADTIDSFWTARLKDLNSVLLEGKKRDEFKSRQEVSVNELTNKVEQFETFIETKYLRNKRYLLDSLKTDKPSEWEFLGSNKAQILEMIEKHCTDHVLDIGQVFTHFVKDELELLLPRVSELCQQRRDELLDILHESLHSLLAATEAHTKVRLDVETLCEVWLSTGLLIPDERNLNNFIRELPFEATNIMSKVLLPSINIGNLTDAACKDKMLGYVVSAWTEVLQSKDTFSMVSYNKESVTWCLDNLDEHITNYVSTYIKALADGVETLMSDTTDIETHTEEVLSQHRAISPLLQNTTHLSTYLRDSVNWEYHVAHAVAQELALKRSEMQNEVAAA